MILVNGEAVDSLPADDSAVVHGVGVFETLRTYGSIPFRLKAHMSRLQQSAEALGIPCDIGLVEAECRSHCREDSSLRVTLTGSGNRILQIREIDSSYVASPRHVAAIESPPTIGLPGTVKHTSRVPWLAAAAALDVDEVLLCALDGRILEANRSNVFAVHGGILKTPPLDGDQLEGVTRGALIDAAQRAGLPLEETALYSWDDFDALYLSSTLKELAPVVRFGEQALPEWEPLGNALLSAFRVLVAEECS